MLGVIVNRLCLREKTTINANFANYKIIRLNEK